MQTTMAYSHYYAFLALQLCTLGISVTIARRDALFVFGDSYADTGNHRNDSTASAGEYKPWRKPYGVTRPGFPTGRYSNGRVFTDLYANYLGVHRPTPYAKLNGSAAHDTNVGINFAFGGSGVFPTALFCPNVSTQVSQLRGVIDSGLVSQELINASVALITVNGNDYTQYLSDNRSFQGFPAFIQEVIQQLRVDIESLYTLGFKTLAISNLGPVGCLPSISKSNNYSSCDATYNSLADYHNSLLASNIADLQNNLSNVDFILLDFNEAFNLVLQGLSNGTRSRFRSCCEGIGSATCGGVDKDGVALYTVCPTPSRVFFWDEFHPTDAAWKAISGVIFRTLNNN